MNNPKRIIIHHSGTDTGDVHTFRNHHVNVNGWNDVGYHYVITREGALQKGRAENVVGAHTLGHNQDTIGICLVGNFNNYTPNDQQINTLIKIIKDIRSRYGDIPVGYHRDFGSTSCPGNLFPVDLINQRLSETHDHWAEDDYNYLKNNGIQIHDKRFDETITRGEVIALLRRMFDAVR